MLKKTREFYELTKLKDDLDDSEEKVPITWTKVFHKKYSRFPSIKLPNSKDKESQLETLLDMRESTRIFLDDSISLNDV